MVGTEPWTLFAVMLCPAVLGIAAFVGGLVLLVPAGEDKKLSTGRLVGGVILLIVALGIGVCYGGLLLS
jgi:hypothetical protein